MHQVEAEILANGRAGPYMLMKLKTPGLAKEALPGQFLMLKAAPGPDPLLRRPFSIHDTRPEGVLLLYQVVGRMTGAMSHLTPGESVSLIGPLGRGFSMCEVKRALLVAGGIGIAPLPLLAKNLAAAGVEVTLIAGARTHAGLYTKGFDTVHKTVLTTNDGSEGKKGPVTVTLEALLDGGCADTFIYGCGPGPMLRRVAGLASFYHVPCELSLESRMACGIGACCGCVVEALDEDGEPGYVRVCKEGPVFDSKRLVSF